MSAQSWLIRAVIKRIKFQSQQIMTSRAVRMLDHQHLPQSFKGDILNKAQVKKNESLVVYGTTGTSESSRTSSSTDYTPAVKKAR